jgi:hypothetical protein
MKSMLNMEITIYLLFKFMLNVEITMHLLFKVHVKHGDYHAPIV